jgi:hypothetical protein
VYASKARTRKFGELGPDPYMYVEMISVNNHCSAQIIWKIDKLQTKDYGCHTYTTHVSIITLY